MKKYLGDFALIMVLLSLLVLPFGNLWLSKIQPQDLTGVEVLSIMDSKETSETTSTPDIDTDIDTVPLEN